MKNGAPVSPRADISENGYVGVLVIEGIETDDSGDYSCEALNRAGSMSSTVQIKVRGKILNLHNVLVPFSQWTTYCLTTERMAQSDSMCVEKHVMT